MLFIPFGPNNEAYFSVVTIASLFSFVKRKTVATFLLYAVMIWRR